MNLQQIPYLGPKLRLRVGEVDLSNSVMAFDVWSSLFEPADTCQIVFDPLGFNTGQIVEDTPIYFEWGYKGFDFQPLFNGFVTSLAPYPKSLKQGQRPLLLRGSDPMKRLFDIRVTKTYEQERPSTIIRNMLEPQGISIAQLTDVETTLDRLPLYDDHIVHAIQLINRSLDKQYPFWFDQDSLFHWHPLELPAPRDWLLTEGENIFAFEYDIAASRVTTIGIPASHGQRVDVDLVSSELQSYWIANTHHFQALNQGFRSTLGLIELAA